MIELVGMADRRRFGVEAALRLAGVPFRLGAVSPSSPARAAIVTLDEPGAAVSARRGRWPVVVVGTGGRAGRALPKAATLPIEGPLWAGGVRALAHRWNGGDLRIPSLSLGDPPVGGGATLLSCVDSRGTVRPAVVESDHVLWCPADLGSAFADLLDEGYLPEPATTAHGQAPRWLFDLYYRLPGVLRRSVQRGTYAALSRRVPGEGYTATRYPVDATGWLLAELIVALVRRACGSVLRLAQWPSPFDAAAILTHDVEPTRFAYGPGLSALLRVIRSTEQPAAIGLVADPARRFGGKPLAEQVEATEVYCHGLEHRGETLAGDREQVAARIVAARAALEGQLGRPIEGFRSPRLDRSRTLLWVLDRLGFRFDSSFPDVDRETVERFGHGVRLCAPYRAPIEGMDGSVRASRCLELPVSAPDCIQPLFAGEDEASLAAAVRAKVEFIRATGGLYTGIVHAGVFGRRDSARRLAHLGLVRKIVEDGGLWCARPSEIVTWWEAREQLVVAEEAGVVAVMHRGAAPLVGVRVIVEREGEVPVTFEAPELAPHTTWHLSVPDRSLVGTA